MTTVSVCRLTVGYWSLKELKNFRINLFILFPLCLEGSAFVAVLGEAPLLCGWITVCRGAVQEPVPSPLTEAQLLLTGIREAKRNHTEQSCPPSLTPARAPGCWLDFPALLLGLNITGRGKSRLGLC